MAVIDPVNNTFVTSDLIAKEALLNLNNNLVFAKTLNQPYNYMFGGQKEYIPGDTISFKYQPRYEVRRGMKAEPQDTVEKKGSMTLDILGLDLQFSGAEFSLKDVSVQQKIGIAGQKLAEEIDIAAYKFLMENSYQFYNRPDFMPATGGVEATELLVGAQARLSDLATPTQSRTLITPPLMNASLVSAFSGMFNPSGKISTQYNTGVMVGALGFESKMSQIVPKTYGLNAPADPLEITSFSSPEGASQAKITLKDPLKGIIQKGARIRISGCNFLNPSTLERSQSPFTFMVLQEALVGEKDIYVVPVILTGKYAQVSTPQAGAKVTAYLSSGVAYDTGVLIQSGAMVMGSVPFRATSKMSGQSPGVATSVQKLNGITLTVSSQWDYTYAVTKYRIDVLYGFAMQHPTSSIQILQKSDPAVE